MASSILSKQIYTKTSCAQLQYRKKRRNGLQSHRLSKIWQISIQIQKCAKLLAYQTELSQNERLKVSKIKHNFPAKTSSKNRTIEFVFLSWYLSSQDRKTNSLDCFLEEVLAGKYAFEIYWPLANSKRVTYPTSSYKTRRCYFLNGLSFKGLVKIK